MVELVGSSPTAALAPLSLRVATLQHSDTEKLGGKKDTLQPPTFAAATFSFPLALEASKACDFSCSEFVGQRRHLIQFFGCRALRASPGK